MKYIIFGAGNIGTSMSKFTRHEIFAYCDNDKQKIGKSINNIPVISVKEAVEAVKPPTSVYKILLYPRAVYDAILKQLFELGATKDKIVFGSTLHITDTEYKVAEDFENFLGLVGFSLCDGCNLNCAACMVAAPLADHTAFPDNEVLFRDMDRLNTLGLEIGVIRLAGGEPLLNPSIEEINRYARKAFPKSKIEYISNGILIKSMKDSFWEMLVETDSEIAITHYPINLDYEEIIRYVIERGVSVRFFGSSESVKQFAHMNYNPRGNENASLTYEKCSFKNCLRLINGILYPCSQITSIKYINKAFGDIFEIAHYEGIDIYSTKNYRELLSKLTIHPNFCKYCNQSNHTVHNWEVSKKDKSEWIKNI